MLCSRFLQRPRRIQHRLAYRVTEAGFQGMLTLYNVSLRTVLRYRGGDAGGLGGHPGRHGVPGRHHPQGLHPDGGPRSDPVQTEAAQDISFDAMVAHQLALAEILRDDPDVDAFHVQRRGGNTGRMFVVLKPRAQRTPTADQIIEQLRPKLASVPGIKAYLTNPLAINVGGQHEPKPVPVDPPGRRHGRPVPLRRRPGGEAATGCPASWTSAATCS